MRPNARARYFFCSPQIFAAPVVENATIVSPSTQYGPLARKMVWIPPVPPRARVPTYYDSIYEIALETYENALETVYNWNVGRSASFKRVLTKKRGGTHVYRASGSSCQQVR
jgi:hypothetical protein